MIILKTSRELELMRTACHISAMALKIVGDAVEPGITTKELDTLAYNYIKKQGAKPNFLGLYGFPATACISVNDEVIHGIPSGRRLVEGDIISVDLGAEIGGYNGDNAATFAVGDISPEAKGLMDATEQSLYEGIAAAKSGGRVGDISSAVQKYVEARGYSVVRDYVGHGVGASLHESPEIPNYGIQGKGARLMPGMTLAIEPMINMGTYKVNVEPDGWTVRTADGKYSAHFEHTIAITSSETVILTKL